MGEIRASKLLRAGLLEGVSIVLAAADEHVDQQAEPNGRPRVASAAGAIESECTRLGARVRRCALPQAADGSEQDQVDEAVARVLTELAGADLLIVDAAGAFARARAQAPSALHGCLQAAWSVTRAVANAAFLPDGAGGRIVYVAPPPGAGPHAGAARAGLENLARTLSIEWARHGITTIAIAPGDRTDPHELAALNAYLASPAGAYFSGCRLDLHALDAATPA